MFETVSWNYNPLFVVIFKHFLTNCSQYPSLQKDFFTPHLGLGGLGVDWVAWGWIGWLGITCGGLGGLWWLGMACGGLGGLGWVGVAWGWLEGGLGGLGWLGEPESGKQFHRKLKAFEATEARIFFVL